MMRGVRVRMRGWLRGEGWRDEEVEHGGVRMRGGLRVLDANNGMACAVASELA